MDDQITPCLPREEREKSQADRPSTLGDRLRLEASLAKEDYLNDLIQLGRTNDQSDHESMERVRLQYLRLHEAALWANGLDEEPLEYL